MNISLKRHGIELKISGDLNVPDPRSIFEGRELK
jgi:hypothetical protein